MTDMIKFNISASSYGVFKQSPLQFYYQYIIKANPDTPTIQSYGLAGNVVHKMLEEYNEGVKFDTKEEFHKRWINKNLDTLPGISFNGRPGKPLDESSYLRAVKYGIRMSDKLYNITENELYLNFPFVNDDIVDINIKGYIDFIAEKNEEVIIGDWKTNSSMRDFTVAAKMYHLLYYKEFGIMPIKASYEYLKMGKSKPYKFTLEDIMDFENFRKLSKSPCKYCGLKYSKIIEDRQNETKKGKLNSRHILKINGIDRVNNNIGYTNKNSVSCCKVCNFAKHTQTKKDFYKWVKKIYEYNFR